MKTILFDYSDDPFVTGVRDNATEPFICLREKLRSLGYAFETADEKPLTDCAWVFFIDASTAVHYSSLKGKLRWLRSILSGQRPARNLYTECCNGNLKNNVVLFLWEGPAVAPENYRKSLHELFPYIFTWNDELVDNRRYFKLYPPWPQQSNPPPRVPFRDKKLLVTISMNKSSSAPGELYSARRGAIRYFGSNLPDDFDLFGVGWNMPSGEGSSATIEHYPSYRGPVTSKLSVLPRYKFSLCYENVYGVPGLITEKIFDSMWSGTIPIYLGAPNVENYVDADAFIDRRRFDSDADLAQFIKYMSESEYSRRLAVIDSFLKSDRFSLFSSENFANTIIKTLKL